VFGHLQERQRRDALQQWAAARGLRFRQDKLRDFQSRYPHFDCLRQGERNRYAFNVIDGDWSGRPITAFDYHYETTSTDSKGRRTRHSHYFSAVIVHSELRLEPLLIRPEGVFDKIKGFLGFDDINFESAQFSRTFHVSAPERRWAYDVIHARAMQMLLDSPRFTIQFDRQSVIATQSGRWDCPRLEQAAGVLTGLLDGLPAYVRQQQQERP
jgi:hypothetical protein